MVGRFTTMIGYCRVRLSGLGGLGGASQDKTCRLWALHSLRQRSLGQRLCGGVAIDLLAWLGVTTRRLRERAIRTCERYISTPRVCSLPVRLSSRAITWDGLAAGWFAISCLRYSRRSHGPA